MIEAAAGSTAQLWTGTCRNRSTLTIQEKAPIPNELFGDFIRLDVERIIAVDVVDRICAEIGFSAPHVAAEIILGEQATGNADEYFVSHRRPREREVLVAERL